jgi:hypothetical protein
LCQESGSSKEEALKRKVGMTNIFGTPEKVAMRNKLFSAASTALEERGWKVERIPRSGKASVRRITRGDETKIISIRTSQDRDIAFPRDETDTGWATLDGVDCVVASSVDDPANPKFALVHMIDADEMRERFDRAYAARMKAGHSVPPGRGIWISLYENEASHPVSLVGAGAGIAHPPIAKVPLNDGNSAETMAQVDKELAPKASLPAEPPLSIREAKRRLALSLGVNEADIKIIVSS